MDLSVKVLTNSSVGITQMPQITEFQTSRHAQQRMGQRGITHEFLSNLLINADREQQVRGGAVALSVSKQQAVALNLGDRLCRYAVIISADGCIITVLPFHSRRRSGRYRRN